MTVTGLGKFILKRGLPFLPIRNSPIDLDAVNHLLFYIFAPICVSGALGHILGLTYTWTTEKPFPKTIKWWIIVISLADILHVTVGGIAYLILGITLEDSATGDALRIARFLQYFVESLGPMLSLAFSWEKVIAVTWPLKRKKLIGVCKATGAMTGIVLYTAVMFALWEIFRYSDFVTETNNFIYFSWFDLVVNRLGAGLCHLMASALII